MSADPKDAAARSAWDNIMRYHDTSAKQILRKYSHSKEAIIAVLKTIDGVGSYSGHGSQSSGSAVNEGAMTVLKGFEKELLTKAPAASMASSSSSSSGALVDHEKKAYNTAMRQSLTQLIDDRSKGLGEIRTILDTQHVGWDKDKKLVDYLALATKTRKLEHTSQGHKKN
jgi:hypothetical protein